MTRTISLALAFMLNSLLVHAASEDFKETVERHNHILSMIADCNEGYAETVVGSTLMYGSFRPDPQRAMITRATTGAMGITWKTSPVPRALPGNEIRFVVMTGMYGQKPSGFTFHVSINDVPRFDFVTSPLQNWEATGKDGGKLQFLGAVKDKYGDIFGCLRITLPASWVQPGEQTRITIVGEKKNHSAWFMVFEAPDVVAYEKALASNESYCDVHLRPEGAGHAVSIQGPRAWQGHAVDLTFGDGSAMTRRLDPDGGSSLATFMVPGTQISPPLVVRVNGELIMRLNTLFTTSATTVVYPLKVVSLSSTPADPTGWHITYQSTYHPGLGTSLQELSQESRGQGTLHLIVSTHQDIAWMDSPENCIRDRDEKIITPLLGIMKRDSTYHFDLEDVLCLREYLGRHPDRKAEMYLYMKEGRLGVGASFNQPYEDLCSGEMLVRQFYAGRRWFRNQFPGCDTKTYWNMDVPGRTQQIPQIMLKAGVEYLVMSRFEKGLYSWFSPDGSSITAFSPGHYADFKARVEGAGFEQAAGYVASTASEWLKATRFISRDLPLVSMSDMSGPDTYNEFLAKWGNARSIVNTDGSIAPLSLPPVRYSRVEQFLDAVSSARPGLPAIEGDRPNIWLYIHGPTHHRAISAKREADFFLPAAETFNTIDALLRKSFALYPQSELTAAWESQLYPDHGWGGKNGDVTDSTFNARYESASDISKRLLSQSLTSIASQVKTRTGKNIPVVIFNSLSWKRSGPVQVTTHLATGVAPIALRLCDPDGNTIPMDVDITHRHPDGSIETADLYFVARDVPPVGYATYYLHPTREDHAPSNRATSTTILENEHYRVILGAGGVRQIVDKELKESLLDTTRFLGGELFTMQSVGEDAGEWDEPQQPTMEGFDKLSNHAAPWQRTESGPVRDIVEARYLLDHVTVVQRIVLFHAIKRIDFEVSLLGWDGMPYREFRLAFPVRAEHGQVAYEVPFGALEVGKGEMKGSAGERYKQLVSRVRPRGIQNWIGLSGLRFGVTLSSSVSVWDYQDPTDPVTDRLLLQPVLLASRKSCHGEGPWYLQRGDHHYRFSLTSHAPGWQNGQRQGIEANAPLIAIVSPARDPQAHLPESTGFVSPGADNVSLSTMKKCEDDATVILRLVNNTGDAVDSDIRIFIPLLKAEETTLLEEGGTAIAHHGNRVRLHLGRHAISTVKLTPKW
jgi:alpha-mannosidase